MRDTHSLGLDRRDFVKLLAGTAAAAGCGLPFASLRSSAVDRKLIVLGLDGLDPTMVKLLIDTGRAPNFKRLAEMGSFSRLATTMPALSPVAWASFITGLTPGGHGIGDFIVRDPATYMPVFSIYETRDADRTLSIGDYRLPLSGGGAANLRRGKPFWTHLTERGIPAVISRIPTNFPVDSTATSAISGMGTPDLTDAYGMFSYYTSDEYDYFPKLTGGRVSYVEPRDNVVTADLIGPENTLRAPRDTRRDPLANAARIPFRVYLDPGNNAARIDVQGQTVVLNQGEFSGWVKLSFAMMPVLGTVSGIARFLLKEVHPHLKLYVSPINIDPADQAMPVTHPSEYGAEIARDLGSFWTKGLPSDTKAFDHRVFSDEDYVKQAELILAEQMALFDYQWQRFTHGLFFFYVSSTDQDAHMLWRNMDPTHPMHASSDLRFSGYLHHLYEEMDRLVGKVLPAVDDRTLLLICSDHGFAQFGRQFHLNTWLRDSGYLKLKAGAERKAKTSILDVDWSQTLAYGIGFNGLYLNLKDREAQGIVEPTKAGEVAGRISRELEAVTDPDTGQRPVARVYRRDDMYVGPATAAMPELLVGYQPGYRCSSPSVLGETGKPVIDLNPWAWSGDHSMARDLVPGSLFSSVKLTKPNPSILDLPVTILELFGVEKPAEMVGSSIF